MNLINSYFVRLFLIFFIGGYLSPSVFAHPHVIVSVHADIILDEKGFISSLRHVWAFDEAFSAFATTGFDTNKDGKFSKEELAPLAQTNVESLSEYGFFSFLKKEKEKAEFEQPKDYFLEYDGKHLVLHFTLPLKTKKFTLNEVKFEVYDPSYFVAFEFAPKDPIKVEGGNNDCKAQISPPKAEVAARLSKMSESSFQSLPNNAASDWAIPVSFICQDVSK